MNTSRKDQNFRNYIDYPYNNAIKKGNRPPRQKPRYPFNASGYNMCCGLAATGDEAEAAPVAEAPKVVDSTAKLQKVQALGYAKTALALVGLYVIASFLYKKYVK